MAQKERGKVQEIINRAVEKSRIPGAPSLGTNGGSGVLISPGIEGNNYADADGYTVRGFMLGVDALGDSRRFLIVKGKEKNYGS